MGKINNAELAPNLVAQDIYDISATQKHPLGTRLVLGERVFRYSLAGASALVAGKLNESAAFGGSLSAIQETLAVPTAVAVGSSTVGVTTLTDATVANLYADGYLTVYDGAVADGVGQTYKIKSHPATTAAGLLTLTLYDDLVVALTTSAKVSLCANLYRKVLTSAVTTPVGAPTGVSLVAVTAAYYFWQQTWGPVCVLADGTWTLNTPLARSAATAGAVDICAAGGVGIVLYPVLGYALEPAADTKYGLMYLMLAS